MGEIRIRAQSESLLNDGDTVHVGITSAVTINGDDNWFKLETTTTVRPGEHSSDAVGRVEKFLHTHFKAFVEDTAHLVMSVGD